MADPTGLAPMTPTGVLDHGPACLIVTGAPGAGKSTVSRLVAQALERSALLVVLDPGAAACRHRDAARDPDEQFRFDGHEALTAAMRDGFGDLGWWFDTADHTAEQTAAQLVTLAPRLARRGLGSAGAPAWTNHEGGR